MMKDTEKFKEKWSKTSTEESTSKDAAMQSNGKSIWFQNIFFVAVLVTCFYLASMYQENRTVEIDLN